MIENGEWATHFHFFHCMALQKGSSKSIQLLFGEWLLFVTLSHTERLWVILPFIQHTFNALVIHFCLFCDETRIVYTKQHDTTARTTATKL